MTRKKKSFDVDGYIADLKRTAEAAILTLVPKVYRGATPNPPGTP